jgi:cytochrome c551/c552
MKREHTSFAALVVTLVALASCTKHEPSAQMPNAAPETIRYEAHVPAGGIEPVGGTFKNPHKGNARSAEAGATLFSTMNCDGCHGGGGTGWVGPSLADGRWRYGGADDEIFYSIFYGRPKGMPAYGGVLGTEGVWMLVTYLQSVPVPDTVPTQSWENVADSASAAPASTAAPVAAAAAASTPAPALTPEAMLTKYGCTACHSIDQKVIGPAFKEVAAKYRNQDVHAALVTKISNGGVGAWGPIPMPPNPSVSDAELATIVSWILALK